MNFQDGSKRIFPIQLQSDSKEANHGRRSQSPKHYNENPSGIECIQVVRHLGFNIGNAIKYCWRAGFKSRNAIEDLQKAIWYIEDEIVRLKTANTKRYAAQRRNKK